MSSAEHGSADTLTFGLWPPDCEREFLLLQVCSDLLGQQQEFNMVCAFFFFFVFRPHWAFMQLSGSLLLDEVVGA